MIVFFWPQMSLQEANVIYSMLSMAECVSKKDLDTPGNSYFNFLLCLLLLTIKQTVSLWYVYICVWVCLCRKVHICSSSCYIILMVQSMTLVFIMFRWLFRAITWLLAPVPASVPCHTSSIVGGTIAVWRSRQLFRGVTWLFVPVLASWFQHQGHMMSAASSMVLLHFWCWDNWIEVSHDFLGTFLCLLILLGRLIFWLSHLCL